MIPPLPPPGFKPEAGSADTARLRQAAAGMEAVFYGELLKAMRETIPQDGAIDSSAGQEIFTGMLDAHVAELAAARQEDGLGAALYRQLVRLLGHAPGEEAK